MTTESRIFDLLDMHMGGPFGWGHQDCFLSTSSVFLCVTGVDLASDLRGTYRTASEAERILGTFGGSLEVFLSVKANQFGLRQVDPDDAPLGSIGVSEREAAHGLDGRCICIKARPRLWAAKAFRGYTLIPRAKVCFYV